MTAVALRIAAFPHATKLALLALAYFAAAKASLVFAIPPGYATAVWLPSGIAVAAIAGWGPRCWPGVWAGAALANFSVNLSLPAAIGIATGNALEALCAGWLTGALFRRGEGFRNPEGVLQFAVIAAAASAIAATLGPAALVLAGGIDAAAFTAHWYTWWLGDTTGILVVTPCVMAWAHGGPPQRHGSPRYEGAAFAALFGGALLVIFARPADDATRAVAFLAFPFLAWAACRLSERAVTGAVLAATALAVWCTVNGRGPFAGASLNESLLSLLAFTSTAALIALALRTFTRQRDQALHRLSASNDALEAAVRAQDSAMAAREHAFAQAQALAHVGTWTWDSRSDRMSWSDELSRIHGLAPGAFRGGFSGYLERVDARDRERIRERLHEAIFAGRAWDTIERIVRPDGAARVLHSFCRVAPRRSGEPVRLHAFCVDITERVRLEQVQAAQHEIALGLALAPAVPHAVSAVLRILAEKLEFTLLRYWRCMPDAGGLRLAAAHPPASASGAPTPEARPVAVTQRAWREQRVLFERDGACGAMAFPVAAGGHVAGMIEAHGGASLDPDEPLREMASATGALLGEYLARCDTEQEMRAAHARVRALSQRLHDADEAERRWLAEELREAVVRPLAAAQAALDASRLEAPLAAARELVVALRPAALEDHGLLAALRDHARRFERRTRVSVTVIGTEDAAALAPSVETALFQIARDALDNVARHAAAHSAVVELGITGGTVTLAVGDDGCGFDVSAAAAGSGLARMRERAASIGGRLRVDSSPGQGTRVVVRARR